MKQLKNNVTGYILAGGKSSRMGEDKGLLMLNNKPIVLYIIEQMQFVLNNIIIVSDNREYEKYGLEVIPDTIKNCGPAGGILASLKHSKTEFNFIISCDMPFVNKEAISFLLQNTNGFEIILPVFKGNYEPLFGIYSKSCFEKWEELVHNNENKLLNLANHFELNSIDVDENPVFGKDFFMNINTKKDLEMASKIIVENEN